MDQSVTSNKIYITISCATQLAAQLYTSSTMTYKLSKLDQTDLVFGL